MATYLDWQSYEPRSAERILSSMFYYLSPRWYPVNVLNSSTYDVMMMYADQLSSASIETKNVYDDLFIDSIRTVPVADSSTARIYDNFGYQLGATKFYNQNYETFNSGSVRQSYRQQLRFLIAAQFAPTSIESVNLVGQSYSGMSPVVLEPAVTYDGWYLYSQSGSVVDTFDHTILSDTYIPGFGYTLPSNGSFAPDDTYIISYSKLGSNTVLRDQYYQNSGVLVYIYASSSVSESFQSALEEHLRGVMRADARPLFYYVSQYVYYRPQTSTASVEVDSVWLLSEDGFLVNDVATPASGAIYEGDVLTLPAGYWGYDWYYDWAVFARNETHYTMAVRSYAAETIPTSVYYQNYIPNGGVIPLLPVTSGSVRAHFVPATDTLLGDISGYGQDLYYSSGDSGDTPVRIVSREESKFGVGLVGATTTNAVRYKVTTYTPLNLTNCVSIEMWVRGADANSSGDIYFKRDQASDPSAGLTGNGYYFGVNLDDSMLEFQPTNTLTYTASIATTSELPSRYHYFACSFCSGSLWLYADGELLKTYTGVTTPTAVATGYTFLGIRPNGTDTEYAVGLDELRVTSEPLLPEQAKINFESTKPYLRRLGLASGSIADDFAVTVESPAIGTSADSVFFDGALSDWTNTSEALIGTDATYAYTELVAPGDESYYLRMTDFGLSVPSEAVVTNVTVQIRHSGSAESYDNRLYLFHNNALLGTNQRTQTIFTDTPTTLEHSNATWGASEITPSIVNDSSFGVGVAYASTSGSYVGVSWMKLGVTYEYATGDKYHQPRVTVWASGSFEFEWHQFSMRGLQTPQGYVYDRRTTELLRIPLFASGSL